MMNQKNLDFLIKALGIITILIIGFYLYLGIMKLISIGEIFLSASGFAIYEQPKEKIGITETKTITLKLWNKYQIDVPQNHIKYQKQILHPELNEETLHLWAMYPTFEGFTATNSGIFNAGYQDNNVVQFSLHLIPFTADNERKIKQWYGQEGIESLLKVHKNFERVPERQQPFSNPIEYSQGTKSKGYSYIYNSGDHAIYISCRGSIRQPFHGLTCKAEKIWGKDIAIKYEFGSSNLSKFGQIEKGIDKLLNSFKLRKIKHD